MYVCVYRFTIDLFTYVHKHNIYTCAYIYAFLVYINTFIIYAFTFADDSCIDFIYTCMHAHNIYVRNTLYYIHIQGDSK